MQLFIQDVVGFTYVAIWMGVVISFALPLVFVGTLVTIFSVCFLFWYVVICISWWTCKDLLRRIWHLIPKLSSKHQPRLISSDFLQFLDLGLPSPPHLPIDEPIYDNRPFLKKTESLQSFVGTGLDRDFEGLGGWASSHDEETLWLAKPWDADDSAYSSGQQRRRSASPSTRRSSMSIAPEMRTPLKIPDGVFRLDAHYPSTSPRSRRQSVHRRNNLSTTSFHTDLQGQ